MRYTDSQADGRAQREPQVVMGWMDGWVDALVGGGGWVGRLSAGADRELEPRPKRQM